MLKFCPDFFMHAGKWFDETAKVNLKVYDVINRELTITIHILPNISRSKGNHTQKFSQLIKFIFYLYS